MKNSITAENMKTLAENSKPSLNAILQNIKYNSEKGLRRLNLYNTRSKTFNYNDNTLTELKKLGFEVLDVPLSYYEYKGFFRKQQVKSIFHAILW
jgi:hypothetical protein